jgi:MoaA/NifB/PqqE/SkfB family radical SAM enzyme
LSIIDVTNKCNLNCIYCCRTLKDNEELSNDHILNVCEQIANIRGTFVVLQGGEPLLKSNIVELIESLGKTKNVIPGQFKKSLEDLITKKYSGKKLKKFYIKSIISQSLPLFCVTTNGMIYSSELEDSLFRNAFYIEISLDSNKEAVNKQTRKGIDFERVIKNIKKYSKRNPVEISCTIAEHNSKDLIDMLPFSKALHAICLKLSPVIQIGKRQAHDKLWIYDYINSLDMLSKEIRKIDLLVKVKIYPYMMKDKISRKIINNLEETPNILIEMHQCNAFKKIKDIYIDKDLNMFACASMKNIEELCLGNLHNNSIKEIWGSQIKKEKEENFYSVINKYDPYNLCFENNELACSTTFYKKIMFKKKEKQ